MFPAIVRLMIALMTVPIFACEHSRDSRAAAIGATAGTGPNEPAGPHKSALPDAPCLVQPEDFSLGQETRSKDGRFSVRIVDAQPAPPAMFNNAWQVEVVGPDGATMPNATVIDAEPYMPAHDHNGGYAAKVTPTEPGRFDVTPLYMHMGGGWTVTFTVDIEGKTGEAVVDVCIPE
ncbi:MAG: FixH family protein [Myxococcales bacterium]|nr:FixH family protein [Myxococcales bacterium]